MTERQGERGSVNKIRGGGGNDGGKQKHPKQSNHLQLSATELEPELETATGMLRTGGLLCIYMPALDRSLSYCIYMPALDRSLSLSLSLSL